MKAHLEQKFPHLKKDQICTSLKLSNGDLQKAYFNIEAGEELKEQFLLFQSWMRMSVSKGSLEAIKSFVEQISKTGREKQKDFLQYCLRLFRECLITNYGHPSLNRLTAYEQEFFVRFAPHVHINNRQIIEKFDKAIYEIGRNANASVLFMDLSLSMSVLLKIKE